MTLFKSMNYAQKATVLFFVLLISIDSTHGIDLRTKIPKNALCVFTINSQNIVAKMPVAALNKLSIVREFCGKLADDSIPLGLDDLGINKGSASYFFVEMTDSIVYSTFLFPLSDSKKFEAFFIEDSLPKPDSNGNSTLIKETMSFFWNKDYAMIITGEVMTGYFLQNEGIYSRYGFEEFEEIEGDASMALLDTTTNFIPVDSIPVVYPVVESEVVSPIMDGEFIDTLKTDVAVGAAPVDSAVVMEYYVGADEEAYQEYDYTPNSGDYVDQEERTTKQRQKQIAMRWSRERLSKIVLLSVAESIVSKEEFLTSQNKDAEASLWLGSNQAVLFDLLKSTYASTLGAAFFHSTLQEKSPLWSNKNYMAANLHFNNNTVQLDFTNGMDERLFGPYSRMANAKLNKKFFQYIPSENFLGYYSFAYNTQAIIEEIPRLMKPYLMLMPYTSDIASELMDLYSLLIDEAAIGKLVCGDGVFVVTDLIKTAIPYSNYSYDSMYNYTETIETRTEMIPEFVFMYSTENPAFMDKLFCIAQKKGVLIKIDENHYETPALSSIPFTVSFLQKDGIVFVCNSKKQVAIIKKGNVQQKIPSAMVKSMRTNSGSFYMDVKKTLTLIPSQKQGQSLDLFTYAQENAGTLTFINSKPKHNKLSSAITITLPDGKENGEAYFFGLMDTFYKLSKGLE